MLPYNILMSTNSSVYGDSDNVYLNLTITNNLTSAGGGVFNERSIPASLSVNKTIAIIDKPSDYYLSVIRFSIPLNAIPLMICPIVPNQNQPRLMPLQFGIFYNGVNYTTPLNYVPQNILTPPIQNQPTQIITPYYFIYSYEQFLASINDALEFDWVNSGLAALFPAVPAPYFHYDASTQLVSLTAPNCFTVLTAPAVAVPVLYMNQIAIKYLEGFNVIFRGINQVDGRDYDFLTTTAVFGATQDNVFTATQYRWFQDYQTVGSWSNLNTLIISSPTLPCVAESVPSNNIGSNNSNNTTTNSFSILTDFIPNIDAPGQSRSIAYYYPQGQYRLVNMVTDIPVSNLTINIFWTDIAGNIYPLNLHVGQTASIKIGFFRKSLYKQSTNKLLLYS
jgi:hypothetical protein